MPCYHHRLYVLIKRRLEKYWQTSKSQKKRVLTSEKAHKRNVAVVQPEDCRSRATREAIAAGDKAAAEPPTKVAAQKLDKAAGAGVIHKNQAANLSRSLWPSTPLSFRNSL